MVQALEKFDPVMGEAEWHGHEETSRPTPPDLEVYIDALQWADACVFCFPTWWCGMPAILKGYFDRVWLPGISFELVGGKVQSRLRHIRKLGAVMTYGATPFRAFVAGNPPKKIVKRVLRAQINPWSPVTYLAHYDMNNCTEETRARFMAKVKAKMERF